MTQPTIAPRPHWSPTFALDSIRGIRDRDFITVLGGINISQPFLVVFASNKDNDSLVRLTLDSAKELVNQIQTAIKLLEDETKTDRN